MTGHPDGDLVESGPNPFPELAKEIAVLLSVFDIRENAHQLIAVHLSGMLPLAFYPLSFGRNCAKVTTKLYQGFGDQSIRHRAAVVKPERQQNLESPAGNAHRWLVLGL